jgi:hypothetical protein
MCGGWSSEQLVKCGAAIGVERGFGLRMEEIIAYNIVDKSFEALSKPWMAADVGNAEVSCVGEAGVLWVLGGIPDVQKNWSRSLAVVGARSIKGDGRAETYRIRTSFEVAPQERILSLRQDGDKQGQPHNAHQSQRSENGCVCSVEVEVIRHLRRSDSVILIVRLPGGTQVALPDWMLSAQICDQFTNEADPRVSIDALFDLRRLIDAHHLGKASKDHGCAESPSGGKNA